MEQPDTRTPDQLQADYYHKSYAALTEISKNIGAIRGWVTFFGILVLLYMALQVFNILLSF